MKHSGARPPPPTKDELVAFVAENGGKAGVREIARAFGMKNADRATLRHMLRDLAENGRVERRGKKLYRPGILPDVVVAEISGRDADGELIAVPAEWDEGAHGPAPKIHVRTIRRARPAAVAGVGDRALLRIDQRSAEGHHSARVIKLIDRSRQRVLGIYRTSPRDGGRIIPVDKKHLGHQYLVAAGGGAEADDGDLVAAEVTAARRGHGPPTARIKERLGSVASERAVSLIAIHAHDIPHVFPAPALAEAQAAKPATGAGRENWCDLPLITIDPVDAKDHDDAVHATHDTADDNRGGFDISLAIADVAHYVHPGSALDREALRRGNSVYFPDRVVPMLPERISNDLCSLRPGESRGALAVRIIIGPDGRKRSHSFHRVLMRSVAKLNYVQVQAAIDGRPDETTGPLLTPIIEPLYAAYRCLKQARDERAPLDLELPERKIVLTARNTVDHVVTPERLDSHRLIEEFMILANVAAAETLERARIPLLYRVHDEPDPERVNALRELLRSLDISLPRSGALRAAQFNRILQRVKGRDTEKLINEVVLRTQAQAEYGSDNYGHFGLNLRRYAHFTSPIRRYADLIVHRGIIRALKLGDGGLPANQDAAALADIGAKISAAERRAMKAERETFDRLLAHFLADRIGTVFEGHISGTTRAGLFIKLDDTGADGFIPARSVGSEYFRFHEDRHALIGDRTGETYRLGDRVTVRLVEAAPVSGALRFELLSGPRVARPPGHRHAARPSRAQGRTERPSKRARR